MSDVVKQRMYDGLVELLPDWESRANREDGFAKIYHELLLAISGDRVKRIARNHPGGIIPWGAVWVSDEPPRTEEVDGFKEAKSHKRRAARNGKMVSWDKP